MNTILSLMVWGMTLLYVMSVGLLVNLNLKGRWLAIIQCRNQDKIRWISPCLLLRNIDLPYNGSGINEENHIVNGSRIAWLIDDSIGAILSVPFCPYHFVPYHFVLEPYILYLPLDLSLPYAIPNGQERTAGLGYMLSMMRKCIMVQLGKPKNKERRGNLCILRSANFCMC